MLTPDPWNSTLLGVLGAMWIVFICGDRTVSLVVLGVIALLLVLP